MWAIVEPLLIHYALPEVLSMLVRAGMMTLTQQSAIQTIADLKLFIDSLKFTYTYPSDPPATLTPNNLGSQRVE